MNYHHLSIEERSCIRKYYVDGLSYREIARLIGRNVSTVSREIRRNCTHMYDIPTYYPHTAQKKYLLRRSYCHRGMFHSQEVIDYINAKLEATWSPEQISCTPCELKMPSWRTIYRWIYEKYLVNGNLKVLRHKGKSHGTKETRGKYSKGKSIRKRDKSVYSRKEAGHWEADTVVSGQGKSKACFATLAERKTRFYIALKIPDRKAETMENAICTITPYLPRDRTHVPSNQPCNLSITESIYVIFPYTTTFFYAKMMIVHTVSSWYFGCLTTPFYHRGSV